MRSSAKTATRCLRFVALGLAVLLVASAQAEAGQKRSKKARARLGIPRADVGLDMNVRDALVVRAGFRLAFERIGQFPTCGALFAGLDLDGTTALSSTSYSSPRPGPERALCDRGALAVTRAGRSEIRLCSRLTNLATEGVAAILIHEALHTAGLGEWPDDPAAPTSAAITRAVLRACQLG